MSASQAVNREPRTPTLGLQSHMRATKHMEGCLGPGAGPGSSRLHADSQPRPTGERCLADTQHFPGQAEQSELRPGDDSLLPGLSH